MSVQFVCPNKACRSRLQVDARYIGRPVKCPKCNSFVIVPGSDGTNFGDTEPLDADSSEPAVTVLFDDGDSPKVDDSQLASLDHFIQARGQGLEAIEAVRS